MIVGLPDNAVKESLQDREQPLKEWLPGTENKSVVNLAPADIKKSGITFRSSDRHWHTRGSDQLRNQEALSN